MTKRHCWTYLNAEGMAVWGDVFPDTKIPVQSMIPEIAALGPQAETESVYIVSWDELTLKQKTQIVELLSEKFKATSHEIVKQIVSKGIPLRTTLTSGSGTDAPEFFT